MVQGHLSKLAFKDDVLSLTFQWIADKKGGRWVERKHRKIIRLRVARVTAFRVQPGVFEFAITARRRTCRLITPGTPGQLSKEDVMPAPR